MLEALLILFLCQLAGEAAARLLELPVPGPVIGMGLLFLALQARRAWSSAAQPVEDTALGASSSFLLTHLSLLFVPAGVGVLAHLPTLARHGIGLAVALALSTLLSLAAAALVFVALARRGGDEA